MTTNTMMNTTTRTTTNRNHLFSNPSLMLAAITAAAGLAGTPAWAQTDAPKTYNVPHDFKLKTGGDVPPKVSLIYKCETYARTKTCANKDKQKGEVTIGLGVTNKTSESLAPSSKAKAEAEANITSLKAGEVAGTETAKGSAEASLAGCGKPVGSGYAEASSSAKIKAVGGKKDKKGNVEWKGQWKHSKGVKGKAAQRVAKDPIIARLIDKTTGVTTEWTLLSIKSTLSGGTTSWDNGILSSDAANMTFEATVGAPVLPPSQSGTIRFRAVEGLVTESINTGIFAGMGLPPVGAPAGFSVPMPAISLDFDLGGDDTHDEQVEFEMDGAAEENDAAGAVEDDSNCTLVTDLSTGHDSSDLSTPTIGDSVLGFTCSMGQFHLADDIIGPKGTEPLFLDSLDWPVYQTSAPLGAPIQAVFVRLWAGNPMLGGIPIAGNLSTNRLIDVRFPGVMRTPIDQPMNPQREVKMARVDMSWAPPLAPGQQVYIEVAALGLQAFPGPFTPPSPYPNPEWDNALQFNVQTQQWQPAHDQQSGRPVSIPFQLFSVAQGAPTCYPDCDQDGALSIDDFICFQTFFALQDLYADCDADGALSIDDFICFQTLFAIGC